MFFVDALHIFALCHQRSFSQLKYFGPIQEVAPFAEKTFSHQYFCRKLFWQPCLQQGVRAVLPNREYRVV